MAYNQPLTVPPGVIRRQALEDVLKYPSDTQLVHKATEEYRDMLVVEKYFSEIDPDKHINLCERYKRMSVVSYTEFAKDLLEENKDSKLIKHIWGIFQSKKLFLCQKAILEYGLLNDICTAYGKHIGIQNRRDILNSTNSSKNPRASGVAVDEPVEFNGQMYYPETMYKQLEHAESEQFKTIDTLQKHLKDRNLQLSHLQISQLEDTNMIKDLEHKTEELSRLLKKDREMNENVRTKNHKELIEKDEDIRELRKEKTKLKDETEQLKQELTKIKNKVHTGVDKTETTASEQTDINMALSETSNRFAQCPIVEGNWSSEKEAELLSLQEQNKSHEDSMMTILKAKRTKEDENSKLKTKVQQLERDFLKKAKEVDSLKIEKQTLEERLNKQAKI